MGLAFGENCARLTPPSGHRAGTSLLDDRSFRELDDRSEHVTRQVIMFCEASGGGLVTARLGWGRRSIATLTNRCQMSKRVKPSASKRWSPPFTSWPEEKRRPATSQKLTERQVPVRHQGCTDMRILCTSRRKEQSLVRSHSWWSPCTTKSKLPTFSNARMTIQSLHPGKLDALARWKPLLLVSYMKSKSHA